MTAGVAGVAAGGAAGAAGTDAAAGGTGAGSGGWCPIVGRCTGRLRLVRGCRTLTAGVATLAGVGVAGTTYVTSAAEGCVAADVARERCATDSRRGARGACRVAVEA
jgi:hypothetical protein